MTKSKIVSKADADIADEVIAPAAETKEETKPASAGFCCYIGPSILGAVQSNTIMKGTVAEARESLAPAIEKHQLIGKLIVDGNELAEARKKVSTPGNLLYTYYRRLISGKN